MLTLGILQCDQVPEALDNTFANYPNMLQNWLKQSSHTLRFQCYDVRQQHYPTALDACDAYITTGSQYSVYEDIPWINTLASFIQTLYQHNKPYIGICFGHQMLAKALNGTVERSDRGWGIGVARNTITQIQPWMQPVQHSLNLLVSHQDQITQLPENTQVLAHSAFCPYFMIRTGHHMIGIQGHPEFSKTYSQALIQLRHDRIAKPKIAAALATLQHPIHPKIIGDWVLRFINHHN